MRLCVRVRDGASVRAFSWEIFRFQSAHETMAEDRLGDTRQQHGRPLENITNTYESNLWREMPSAPPPAVGGEPKARLVETANQTLLEDEVRLCLSRCLPCIRRC